MNMKYVFAILFLSAAILLAADYASAITASLGNPKMVLYINSSKSEPGIISRYTVVNNVNDFPVNVTVAPDDVLKNLSIIIKDDELSFALQPNSSKNINFTLFASKPQFYDGKIFITYEGTPLDSNKSQKVGLAAQISVNAKGDEFTGDLSRFTKKYGVPYGTSADKESSAVSGGANPIVGIILIVAIVVLGMLTFYLFKRK
ncbi:MAG: hypothetical protein NTV63_01325 [Candidatus Woesearchaeota archaeon]|nr:hypothetical protein [Candidatus Woesearchaeota archaeon]